MQPQEVAAVKVVHSPAAEAVSLAPDISVTDGRSSDSRGRRAAKGWSGSHRPAGKGCLMLRPQSGWFREKPEGLSKGQRRLHDDFGTFPPRKCCIDIFAKSLVTFRKII